MTKLTLIPDTFLRACGHPFYAKPHELHPWFRAAREPCMRCHLEAKEAKQC